MRSISPYFVLFISFMVSSFEDKGVLISKFQILPGAGEQHYSALSNTFADLSKAGCDHTPTPWTLGNKSKSCRWFPQKADLVSKMHRFMRRRHSPLLLHLGNDCDDLLFGAASHI